MKRAYFIVIQGAFLSCLLKRHQSLQTEIKKVAACFSKVNDSLNNLAMTFTSLEQKYKH